MRDCVYSVQCVWGLALAHRRQQGQNSLRSWELQQRVVALMRGLMRSMMRQAAKVERFKESLNPLDALHAKYDSCTCLLYTSPSPRDRTRSRMPSSA